MSIENEYLTLKKQLEVEHNKLLEYQAIEIVEDENNPFSIEERVDAKNRCINSCKESISELNEILAEVEDELREFIANGGEVSELTINELEEDLSSPNDEERIVEFEGVKNNAGIKGYLIVSEADDEAPLNFYNHEGFEIGNRYPQNPFPEYTEDGLKIQNHDDFESLKESMQTDYLLIQYLVDFCTEDKSIDRGDYYLIINEGGEL